MKRLWKRDNLFFWHRYRIRTVWMKPNRVNVFPNRTIFYVAIFCPSPSWILSKERDHFTQICLTSLTRAKWNFPLNFRTMHKLSDLYSRIFQNSLTCAKWNFPLNFRTMRKLSDLYSGIFQTQSSGCASGVDLFRNFTKLKILNIWIVKYLLNCKRYLSYNFRIFQKISECWVLENLDVHLERTTSELEFWNFQHAFLQFSEHTEISTCFFTVFRTCWKFQHAFL